MNIVKLRFAIDKPCPVYKDGSSFTQKETYCTFCKKDVIDFSKMTTEEMQHFFLYRKDKQNICGNLSPNQLEKGVVLNTQFKIPFYPLAKKVAITALVGLTLAISADVIAQTTNEVNKSKQPTIKTTEEGRKIEVYEHPAEYGTITTKKLVRPGGLTIWTEIPCLSPPKDNQELSTISIKPVNTSKEVQEKANKTPE